MIPGGDRAANLRLVTARLAVIRLYEARNRAADCWCLARGERGPAHILDRKSPEPKRSLCGLRAEMADDKRKPLPSEWCSPGLSAPLCGECDRAARFRPVVPVRVPPAHCPVKGCPRGYTSGGPRLCAEHEREDRIERLLTHMHSRRVLNLGTARLPEG